jgi:hypothetical protein
MATNTAGVDARQLPWHAMHYMRKTVNYNDTGISSGVGFKHYLPAGASIMYTMVKIKTAFNAASTNVLTVGTNSTSYNNMVAAGDVDESATEASMVLAGADLTISSDTRVFVKYTQTGDAATTGSAEIVICYVPNNDE